MTRSTWRRVLWSVLAAVLIAALLLYLNPRREPYRSFPSPGGDYTVVVYRYSQRLAMMPGQASDAPGIARLYDRTGKVLYETSVPMVSIVDHVEWGRDTVTVPGLFDWTLGRP